MKYHNKEKSFLFWTSGTDLKENQASSNNNQILMALFQTSISTAYLSSEVQYLFLKINKGLSLFIKSYLF